MRVVFLPFGWFRDGAFGNATSPPATITDHITDIAGLTGVTTAGRESSAICCACSDAVDGAESNFVVGALSCIGCG